MSGMLDYFQPVMGRAQEYMDRAKTFNLQQDVVDPAMGYLAKTPIGNALQLSPEQQMQANAARQIMAQQQQAAQQQQVQVPNSAAPATNAQYLNDKRALDSMSRSQIEAIRKQLQNKR